MESIVVASTIAEKDIEMRFQKTIYLLLAGHPPLVAVCVGEGSPLHLDVGALPSVGVAGGGDGRGGHAGHGGQEGVVCC